MIDGTRTGTFIIANFAERLAIIGGSSYAGEIKKTIFTVLNYLLPLDGVMPMHCSANVGADGNVALFFGLSGTGKTTLSADPARHLIGDDEHGWSDNGVFNFEDGCYAKVIRLSPEAEPQIYACTRRFGTILENVTLDPFTRRLDLNDASVTENTRAAYPLTFIDNAVPERMAGQPTNVVFLTCDASGVLPPISRLSPEQAMYHFISGYTSKIAGTEVGLGIEPEITFSTCFGAPFMVHQPLVYAELLRARMLRSKRDLLARQHRAGPADRSAWASASASGTRAPCSTPRSAASSTPSRIARTRVRLRRAAVVRGRAGRDPRSRPARGRTGASTTTRYDAPGGTVHRELRALRRRLPARGDRRRPPARLIACPRQAATSTACPIATITRRQ